MDASEAGKLLSEAGRKLRACAKKNGGIERAKNLTPEQRSEIATKASYARKSLRDLPRAKFADFMEIGGVTVGVAVLPDGRRLITQTSLNEIIGRKKEGSNSPRKQDTAPENGIKKNYPGEENKNALTLYPEVAPLIPNFMRFDSLANLIQEKDLNDFIPVVFTAPKLFGGKGYGYSATILPLICDIYLEARLQGLLAPNQIKFAERCEILMRALSRVGIIALIDEKTGYQESRDKDELQKLLEKYVLEYQRPWTRQFPEEFFRQVFKIYGWTYLKDKNARPGCIGDFINRFIYDVLPEGVLQELRNKNPCDENGNRRHRHHQFLTKDLGCDGLKQQLVETITLMKGSRSLGEFKELFYRVHPTEQLNLF